ncbi:hypothetical protein BH20ACI1_BH20ACI1_01540 [soil metagenome]
MFDERSKRRSLKREIVFLEKEKSKLDELTDKKELWALNAKVFECHQKLDAIDTDRLLKKAQQLGIEISPDKKNWWWDDFDDAGADNFRHYLTDIGKAGISKLIKEEKRENIEWWVKMFVAIITALTGLIGSIIGVVAVLRK